MSPNTDAKPMRRWRSLLLLALCAAALVWLFSKADSVSVEQHQEYSSKLFRLQHADAELNAAVLANRHAFDLIAEPQGREWSLVRDAVRTLRLGADTTVYIVTPTLDHRSTQRVFSDEFGSLSSDSDWVPAEMFKAALRERFPKGLPPRREVEVRLQPAGDEPLRPALLGRGQGVVLWQ